jgi:vacuolar iron transporter family protein
MADFEKCQEELQSAFLYRALANSEMGTARENLFNRLAIEAETQAAMWWGSGDGAMPVYRPTPRVRLVCWLVRLLGPRRLRHALAAMKVRGMSVYSHAEPGHPMPLTLEDVGLRHKGVATGGNLRAAVFGINDGLVSNASLIMGIAGATGDNAAIILSGIAGLLAGAFSMGAGEYVSVRSQREMFEFQIGEERDELAKYPDAEAAELALIFEARGLPHDEAVSMAKRLVSDPTRALDTLAREELGLDPAQLGSPWIAAAFSFFFFATGASFPLLPFLIFSGAHALFVAIGLTAAALFVVGASISLFTGRSAWFSGARMLLIGTAAGGATYLIGRALGVKLS